MGKENGPKRAKTGPGAPPFRFRDARSATSAPRRLLRGVRSATPRLQRRFAPPCTRLGQTADLRTAAQMLNKGRRRFPATPARRAQRAGRAARARRAARATSVHGVLVFDLVAFPFCKRLRRFRLCRFRPLSFCRLLRGVRSATPAPRRLPRSTLSCKEIPGKNPRLFRIRGKKLKMVNRRLKNGFAQRCGVTFYPLGADGSNDKAVSKS